MQAKLAVPPFRLAKERVPDALRARVGAHEETGDVVFRQSDEPVDGVRARIHMDQNLCARQLAPDALGGAAPVALRHERVRLLVAGKPQVHDGVEVLGGKRSNHGRSKNVM